LATIGAVGDDRSIFNSLVSIIGDTEEPLSLRCTAARSLDGFDYTDVTGIDAVSTARQLGELAAFACRAEDARYKEEEKKIAATAGSGTGGSYPGMGGMGDFPGMGGMDDLPGLGGNGYPGYPGYGESARGRDTEEVDERTNAVRRRLKLPLHCALLGLRGKLQRTGIGTSTTAPVVRGVSQLAADEPQKAEIEKIVAAVDAVVEASDEVEEGLEEMMVQVRVKTRELEALLPNVTEPKSEPAVDDELPGGALPGGALPGGAPAKKDDKAGKG
jgi:hypothetical protein